MSRGLALAIAIAIAASDACAQDTTPALSEANVSVILLGAGTPRPTATVFGPATAVVVGSRTFLFDAGAGVMHQMASAGLGITGPHALFLTHLHSDHTVGLADVIFTSWVMERTKSFKIFGPTGTVRMVDHIEEAYSADVAIRTNGLEKNVPNGWMVQPRDVVQGVVYDSAGVKITAFKVPHGEWETAFGYKIQTPTRTIVISGDTSPSETIARVAAGADVLVHTVYPEPGTTANPASLGHTSPAYFRAYHTSSLELGKLAAKARPTLLLLTHVVRAGATDDELIAGIRTGGFTGNVQVGKELVRY